MDRDSVYLQASVFSHVITAPSTKQYPSEVVITLIIQISAAGVLGIISILKPIGTKGAHEGDWGPREGGQGGQISEVGSVVSMVIILQVRAKLLHDSNRAVTTMPPCYLQQSYTSLAI